MKNAIIVMILLCIAVAVVYYLLRAKKRGETCIGCPYAKQCGAKCSGSCGSAHAEHSAGA